MYNDDGAGVDAVTNQESEYPDGSTDLNISCRELHDLDSKANAEKAEHAQGSEGNIPSLVREIDRGHAIPESPQHQVLASGESNNSNGDKTEMVVGTHSDSGGYREDGNLANVLHGIAPLEKEKSGDYSVRVVQTTYNDQSQINTSDNLDAYVAIQDPKAAEITAEETEIQALEDLISISDSTTQDGGCHEIKKSIEEGATVNTQYGQSLQVPQNDESSVLEGEIQNNSSETNSSASRDVTQMRTSGDSTVAAYSTAMDIQQHESQRHVESRVVNSPILPSAKEITHSLIESPSKTHREMSKTDAPGRGVEDAASTKSIAHVLKDPPEGATLSELQSYSAALLAAGEYLQAVEFLLREVEYWRGTMAKMKAFALNRLKTEEAANSKLESDLLDARTSLASMEVSLNEAKGEIAELRRNNQNITSEGQHLKNLFLQSQDEVVFLRAKVKDLEVSMENTLGDRNKIALLQGQQKECNEKIASLKKTIQVLESEYSTRIETFGLMLERASETVKDESNFSDQFYSIHNSRSHKDEVLHNEPEGMPCKSKEKVYDSSSYLKDKIKIIEQECAKKIRNTASYMNEKLKSRDEEIKKLKEDMLDIEHNKFEELSREIDALSTELATKNNQVGDLKCKVIDLKSQLAQYTNESTGESKNNGTFFEKSLVKRLIINLLDGFDFNESKLDTVKKLANVLDFSSSEATSIGLPHKKSANSPDTTKEMGQGSPLEGLNQSDNSFLDLWVKFLLKNIEEK